MLSVFCVFLYIFEKIGTTCWFYFSFVLSKQPDSSNVRMGLIWKFVAKGVISDVSLTSEYYDMSHYKVQCEIRNVPIQC